LQRAGEYRAEVRSQHDRDRQRHPVRPLQRQHLAEYHGHPDAEHQADREHADVSPADLPGQDEQWPGRFPRPVRAADYPRNGRRPAGDVVGGPVERAVQGEQGGAGPSGRPDGRHGRAGEQSAGDRVCLRRRLRRRPLARGVQRCGRLGGQPGLAEQAHQQGQLPVPAARGRPLGEQLLIGQVEGGNGATAGRADAFGPHRTQVGGQRPVHGGDPALLRRAGEGQPARHQQHQPPANPGQEPQQGQPPRPERTDRPEAQRGIGQKEEAGRRPDGTDRAKQRRYACHHDHDRNGDPAAAVDGRADQQAGRAAEDGRDGDPPHPHQVGAGPVGHRGDQLAQPGDHPRDQMTRGQADGDGHGNRQHGVAHLGPRHRPATRPGHLG